MKLKIGLALAIIAFFLGGCASAPQLPVKLEPSALTTKPARIGVAMTALPKPDTYLPGADCLLCYAAASLANRELTVHTQTLPHEDLPKLKSEIADLIRKKGGDAVVIAEEIKLDDLPNLESKGPNIAGKDFSSLRKKHSIDKLVVINVGTLGFWRTYASYIPTADPKAIIGGTGYMVNLNNNTYEWYLPISIMKSADKNWDEPPKFPGLTNAYFQALELGRDSFLKPFSN
jgi:hypothetical protein